MSPPHERIPFSFFLSGGILRRIGRVFIFGILLLSAGRAEAVWRFSNSGTGQDLNAVYFIDTSTGWTVGASGTILKTVNAGTDWAAQTSGVAVTLHDVKFSGADSSTGVVVGAGGLILRTTDAITWQAMASGTGNTLFAAHWANSTGTVVAVGASGTVRISTDSGYFWRSGDPSGESPSVSLRSVFFVNESTGWAVGDSDTLIRTGNGGNNWTQISPVTTLSALNDVFFVNFSTGFIACDSLFTGPVLKTVNKGDSWSSRLGVATDFNAVHFISTDTGWIAGDGGLIYKSTNSGTTFLQETSSTTNNLSDVFFINSTLGFAVGASGTIIKDSPAGSATDSTFVSTAPITQYGSVRPVNNLFDPSKGESVTIYYRFIIAGRVSLKIYTMQGRLVRTLLDEHSNERPAPVTVVWDGKTDGGEIVSTGIYFVRMEAPNFSQNHKIAVIK
ncbi:MAG: hypothetical protein A2901_02785 [Elusimicrobia bacterium RIFCSPLOWO2_01_FULL_54_10]|nr:MAG: hypothetical protein A2901_02785 [Elusimicrobia bacterium RIFCSPLOWO2_01_FULL_54_10]